MRFALLGQWKALVQTTSSQKPPQVPVVGLTKLFLTRSLASRSKAIFAVSRTFDSTTFSWCGKKCNESAIELPRRTFFFRESTHPNTHYCGFCGRHAHLHAPLAEHRCRLKVFVSYSKKILLELMPTLGPWHLKLAKKLFGRLVA